jgi:hypothetical protein
MLTKIATSLLLVCLLLSDIAQAQITAGTGQTNITPPLGTPLVGYYLERKATDVHDDLLVKAIVLKDRSKSIAIIVVDLLDVDQLAFNSARKRIAEELGIPYESISISATHTHTGPEFDPEYTRFLTTRIFDAVKIASQNQQEVVVKSGSGREENVSFHRRFLMKDGTVKFNPGPLNPDIVRPMGPIDPEVGILLLETKTGEVLAVLVNFAIHLDTVGGTIISADFPGYLSDILKTVLGEETMVMFGLGTCGNINHFNVRSPETLKGFGRTERIGYALAASVIRELPALERVDVDNIKVGHEYLKLEIPKYTKKQVELAKVNAKKESDHESSTPEIREAMKILRVNEREGKPIEVEVQTFGLGDIGIVTLPGEIFVELGLDIKKKSPFKHNFILTLANNKLGYVPNAEAFSYGAYEVEVSNIEAGQGERLATTAVGLLDKMHK